MEDKGDYFEYAGTRIDKKRILELPPQAVTYVSHVLLDLGNKTEGLNQFQFRSSLVSLIPLWVLLYGLIFSMGIFLNFKLIHWISGIRRRRACTAHLFLMHLFMGNSLNDLLIKDIIVLPVSLSTMTGVHWILGRNFCKFFPIVQDSCFYSSSLILLCAFVMRFQHVSHSTFHSGTQVIEFQKSIRHHYSIVILLISFGISLCAIIPHTVYIDFVDLGYYFGQPFAGSGVCFLSQNHIIDYVKYLFIIFYVVPVCLSLSYHFKTTDIIEKWSESSENFVKTKRLTIHRGSLIETSSFINSDPTAVTPAPAGNASSAAAVDDGFRGISHHHVTKAAVSSVNAVATSSASKLAPPAPGSRYTGQLQTIPLIFTSTDGHEDNEMSRSELLHLHLTPGHYQSIERSPGSSNYQSTESSGRPDSGEFQFHRSNSGNRSLRYPSEGGRVIGRREMSRMHQQEYENPGIESKMRGEEERRINRIRSHNSSLRIMRGTASTSTRSGGIKSGGRLNPTATVLPNRDSSGSRDLGESHEYDESKRRNTINFYPAAPPASDSQANGSEVRMHGSVALKNNGSSLIDRCDRDQRRSISGRKIMLQQQRECMMQPRINHSHHPESEESVTSYTSRDPDDIIIHSNPVHDRSHRSSFQRPGISQDQEEEKDLLPDVRVDDVIRNAGAREADESDQEDEEDDEAGDGQRVHLRTSLELENLIQKMMSRILLFHSLLLLPFNILRFVKHLVPGWDAELTLDLAFLSFVGLTFCTILVVPAVTLSSCIPAYELAQERFLRDEDQRMIQK